MKCSAKNAGHPWYLQTKWSKPWIWCQWLMEEDSVYGVRVVAPVNLWSISREEVISSTSPEHSSI
eukprot:12897704-Prorocentrum_lima.AAC.1